ncbi:hypothetical protein K1T71_001372 [Dendrolimus kikuchii]|uniref:Uncharacterized protein n=1 Tax=Dendrolimus kikuchii TaxID=765133 RepID=A0ACC1DHP9_9NEOP|nr:hypothetical protein K1T71_001372 [Dendrolimus kikuchii]
MNKYLFLCTLCCFIMSVLSDLKTILEHELCSRKDNKCFTDFTRAMFDTLVKGDKEVGIESIEPSFVERIDGNMPVVKYVLRNSTLRGFDSCQFRKATLLEEEQRLKLDILCNKFHMCGLYEVNGTLIIVPVSGDGDYCIQAKKYKILVDTKISTYEGDDGKDYVKFDNYKYQAELQGGLDFNLTNLFRGNKDLSDPFLRFARGHWKMVARQIQDPPISTFLNLMIDNFNALMKHVPLDSMVKD